jgi:pyroglutamyl-peptidase
MTGAVAESLVLVSGFGPFETTERNPSGEIAQALARDPPRGLRVVAGILPVSFGRAPGAWDELLASVAPARPRLYLGLGVQKKGGYRLERRARARPKRTQRRDVDGVAAREFAHEGPELATVFALEPLLCALHARGFAEAYVSEDAGGYVCERLYHHLLSRGREHGVAALFVHVPPLHLTAVERQIEVVREVLELAASAA